MTQFNPVEGNPYRSPAGEVVAAEAAARPRFRVLAVVVGLVSMALAGIALAAFPAMVTSMWQTVIAFAATMPSAFLGGWIRAAQQRSKSRH